MTCFRRKEKDLSIHFKWRFCTDLPCFILFVLWWIISAITFLLLRRTSDPDMLLYGRDYNGNLCGSHNNNSFIVYPKVNNDLHVKDLLKVDSTYLFGICVPQCPFAKEVVCTYDFSPPPSYEDVLECYNTHTSITNPMCQHCWIVTTNTTSVLNRCIPVTESTIQRESFCTIPSSEVAPSDPHCLAKRTVMLETTESSTSTSIVSSMIMNISVIIGRWISDIAAAYPIYIITFILAIGCGYCFLGAIRKCSKLSVCILILSGWIGCILLTLLIMNEAEMIPLNSWLVKLLNGGEQLFHWGFFTEEEIKTKLPDLIPLLELSTHTWRLIAWIAIVIDCILFLVALYLIKNITKSIAIMKEASRVTLQLPNLFIVPLISSLCTGVIIVFCIIGLMYTFSSTLTLHDYSSHFDTILQPFIQPNSTLFCDDPQQHTNCTLLPNFISTSSDMEILLLLGTLFSGFWATQFISGIAIMTMAGTIGKWYFKRDEEKKEHNSLWSAFCCTFTFHLGSVAFGSCLMAVTQVFRVATLYLEKRVASSKQEKEGMIRRLFQCFHVCLMSIDKFLRFMNKNAYVLVINRGYSLAKASIRCCELFGLNLGVVSSLNTVYSMYVSIGRIVACILVLIVNNLLLVYCPVLVTHEIIAKTPILLMSLVIAYLVMNCFISVYSVTVDTILLCYCEEKQNCFQTNITDFAKESIDSIDSIDNDTEFIL